MVQILTTFLWFSPLNIAKNYWNCPFQANLLDQLEYMYLRKKGISIKAVCNLSKLELEKCDVDNTTFKAFDLDWNQNNR